MTHTLAKGEPLWQPVEDGVYGMLQVASDGRDIGIQIDDQFEAEHGGNNYEWLSDANGKGLPDDLRLCRAIAAPAVTGVPSDEALDMLRWIVEAYHPQWHYSMEKTGYECAFCKTMFKTSKDFHDIGAHKLGCQWAQSLAWLEQQQQGGSDGKA